MNIWPRLMRVGLVLAVAMAAAVPVMAAEPAAATSAEAKISIPAQIMVLHATNDGGGIDPRIGPMPQLKKPPFSAYDTYKLLSRQTVQLVRNEPDKTALPNERVLQTVLKEVLADSRYRVATSISSDKEKKSFLPLLEVTARSGETFFVAGQSYRGGILVVGIRVGAQPQ